MEYYVYAHRKKTTGEIFYVGKGSGDRAWSRVGRNELWNRTVNKHGYIVEIILDNLQEWYAFELEQELISLYGRVDERTGPLVNMTGGGEGVGGVNHGRYDRSVWTFRNTKTGEILKTTKMFFNNSHPEVHTKALFCGELSSRNWIVEELLTDFQIEAVTSNFTGKYSVTGDKDTYQFVFIKTGEVFEKTRYDMLEFDEKINVSSLLLGTLKSSKGWALKSIYDKYGPDVLLNQGTGRNNGRADLTIYRFKNLVTQEIFIGDRFDFESEYGFNPRDLFTERLNLTTKGWCLLENYEEALISSGKDYRVYEFRHMDGRTFKGTRVQFKDFSGQNSKSLFGKNAFKQVKGWTLVAN